MSSQVQDPGVESPRDRDRPVPRVPLRPVGPPPAARVVPVVAVLLLAVAAVLARDALVAAGLVSGSAWSTSWLAGIDGLSPRAWMVPGGAVAALVGLWLVVTSLRPRPRRDLELGTSGAVWMAPEDAVRLAQAAAGTADEVLDARAAATRRGVKVFVTTTSTQVAPVMADVRSQVETALAHLTPTPTVTVKVSSTGGAS